MPTSSQTQVMRKVGAHGKARAIPRETINDNYVAPPRKIFSFGSQPLVVREEEEADSDNFTYFPEMTQLARLTAHPGKDVEEMTADEIIERLQELGWRKEGAAARLQAEREKR